MFKNTSNIQPFKAHLWLSSPTMHGTELVYMQEAYETNWMSTVGKNINEVEAQMAEYIGMKYAVALSAGTAALHLATKLAGEKIYGQARPNMGTLNKRPVLCSDMTVDASKRHHFENYRHARITAHFLISLKGSCTAAERLGRGFLRDAGSHARFLKGIIGMCAAWIVFFSCRDIQVRVVDTQHFIAEVQVQPSQTFYGWVFTFRGEIEIVAPKNVREEYLSIARREITYFRTW